jgi:outer membrane protein assembly factor BamB
MKKIFVVLLMLYFVTTSNDSFANSSLGIAKTLYADQYLISNNGQYMLYMQYDGNLVLYRTSGEVLWSTGTYKVSSLQNGRARLVMQTDGNLVIYDQQNVARWSSKTAGLASIGIYPFLRLQDDGNLVIYTTYSLDWASYGLPFHATAIWSTGTQQGGGGCQIVTQEFWGGNRDHFGSFNTTTEFRNDCKVKVPWLSSPSSYKVYGYYPINGEFRYGFCYVDRPMSVGVQTREICN